MIGTYPVSQERVTKAEAVIKSTVAQLTPDDVIGILCEAGLSECVRQIDEFCGQISFWFTDLQTVTAAAALYNALDGLRNEPIEVEITAV